jgi:hypothetical protein
MAKQLSKVRVSDRDPAQVGALIGKLRRILDRFERDYPELTGATLEAATS